MKLAPASRSLAVAAALCAVAGFASCRTSSERWYKGDAGKTAWEKGLDKDIQTNMETMNALSRGDKKVDYKGSEFDQKTIGSRTSSYDKKQVRDKTFRTKDFAGSKEFNHGDYQFLDRKDYKAKTAPDQDQRFAAADTAAPDAKRKFFWQRKEARTKAFADADKRANTSTYRDAQKSLDSLERREVNIVDDPAREAGVNLSLGDVRSLLHGSGE